MRWLKPGPTRYTYHFGQGCTPMTDSAPTPDFWRLVYESTPPFLRYVLTVLTAGAFWAVGALWRRQQREIARVEQQLHARVTREMQEVRDRLDTNNQLLIQLVNHDRGDQ